MNDLFKLAEQIQKIAYELEVFGVDVSLDEYKKVVGWKQAAETGPRGGKIIGETKSGKPIYDTHDHEAHKDFGYSDHLDALRANTGKMKEHSAGHAKAKASGDESAQKEHAAAYKHHAAQSEGHGAGMRNAPDPKGTFAEAHAKVRDALKQNGWDVQEGGSVKGPLKVPHATSPDKKDRIYFKDQSLHHSHHPDGGSHTLGNARSMWLNTKKLTHDRDPDAIHKSISKAIK